MFVLLREFTIPQHPVLNVTAPNIRGLNDYRYYCGFLIIITTVSWAPRPYFNYKGPYIMLVGLGAEGVRGSGVGVGGRLESS